MLTLLLVLSCAPKSPEPMAVVAEPPAPPPPPAWAQSVLDAMNPSVSACEDFYQYACGGWIAKNPLPADKPAWSRFSTMRDNNLETLKNILEKAAANPTAGDGDWAKIGNYYAACMDQPALDQSGVAALQPILDSIAKVKDQKSFMRVAAEVAAVGGDPLVSAWIDGDYKNPDESILYISQGGLALPDRDYYLKSDDESKALRAAYESHLATMLGFAGEKDAAKMATAVLALETQLAEASVPRAELRDPDKTYNKIDRAGLLKLTPGLDWNAWLEVSAGKSVDISVEVPDTLKKFESIVKKTKPEVLRAYLRWQAIHAMATQLGTPIYDAHFDMFNRTVLGQKEPEVRWKRCAKETDTALGEITGKYWVAEKFPGESKDKALTMIKDVEDAFVAGLPSLAWMDDATRTRAIEKKDKITNKIGYPDKWRDYAALAVTPGAHAQNVIAARRFEHQRKMNQIGQPADKTEWYMTAQTVNAYYNATVNEMAFPAGILQAPFFDKAFATAINYGGMGSIMGHELSHGFDDQGRKFDGTGKMTEWWSPEVAQGYEARAACVKNQFDQYQVGELNVNGSLTLGENIADLGGARTAFRAYKTRHGNNPATVSSLTEDQLFFVAYAQNWCSVASPQWEKMLILSNPHSPSALRANGPLSNLPEFAAAFGCTEGQPMVRKDRCEVW